MNRSEFIDIKAYKEKVKHPNVAIGQQWRANQPHDFGHGARAYVIKIVMQEPFSNRWVVNCHLETGGGIPNGYHNNINLTEEQIKENFEFYVPVPIQLTTSINVSGTLAYFNPINALAAPNFIQGT